MQIILVQEEIEQAIRNYVNAQINIKEGMTINIDLRSTRGAEGFTANIDITSGSAVTAAIPAGPINRGTTVVPVATEAEPVKSVAAPAATEAKEEIVEQPTGTAGEVPPSPKKSLFGNLKKPVNEPASAE